MPVAAAHTDFPHFFRVLDPEVNPDFYRAWQGDVARQATPRWMSRPYRLTGAGALLTKSRSPATRPAWTGTLIKVQKCMRMC